MAAASSKRGKAPLPGPAHPTPRPVNVDLSFPAIRQAIRALALPPFDAVVGIGRGGVVPASLLAFHLGADLAVMHVNYRDDQNRPRHAAPVLYSPPVLPPGAQTILLVDDVSVTGQTLEAARALLAGYDVTTLVLKGRADYVLFPHIASCVNWPWRAAAARHSRR